MDVVEMRMLRCGGNEDVKMDVEPLFFRFKNV